MERTMNVALLLIDPQNDFCAAGGALPVPGAVEDMNRVSRFVDLYGPKMSKIFVTLDSHHTLDVAHPAFWVDAAGNPPEPLTVISLESFQSGRWKPAGKEHESVTAEYLYRLEKGGRYQLVIWPTHCVIGTWGHGIFPGLADALSRWEAGNKRFVDYRIKGVNPFTEHYSAISPEVPLTETDIDNAFLESVQQCEMLLVAGEALSHSVAATVSDLIERTDDDFAKKIVLLADCTSPVAGFEPIGREFLAEMKEKGLTLGSSSVFPAL